jgi:hypothetical protein
MKNTKILKNCQICNTKIIKVLDLGKHPLCDDLIRINSKRKNKEYPIVIQYCKNCKTAYQKFQVKKKILFPKNYHYRARFTNDVIIGQKYLFEDIKNRYVSLKGKKILDIGCNDGTLLDMFSKEEAITIGIEPTNAFKDASSKHTLYPTFLNQKVSKKIISNFNYIDIIIFTNVFAHINNLEEVLKSLKILICEKTIIVIENHYLGSILEKKQFDTFYHEHPRTYSLTSFLKISKKINLNLDNFTFPKRYGGNIRVILSNQKINKNCKKQLEKEKIFYKKFLTLKKYISIWKVNKKKKIQELNKKYGSLPAKAFPGRAAILLRLLKLNKKNVFSIYEKDNSKKIGFYAPGTKIPIVSDKGLNKIKKNLPIINFAWHIEKEIKNYLEENQINNKLLSIIEKKDFRR